MAKPQPQGMKTNFKTRLAYGLTGTTVVPCLTKHTTCLNYKAKSNDCVRIQGKYTEYKEKKGGV